MSGYCTEAQLALCANTYEVTAWADDAGDGSADTGVKTWAINHASRWIYSIIKAAYPDTTALDPESYTADDYPVIEHMTAMLAVDLLRARQGRKTVDEKHPSIIWARQVMTGLITL